jgi:hypothetical protein
VQFFEHRTDGNQRAQGAVVETRHARDLAGIWEPCVTRRVLRPPPRADRVWHDGPDRTCP